MRRVVWTQEITSFLNSIRFLDDPFFQTVLQKSAITCLSLFQVIIFHIKQSHAINFKTCISLKLQMSPPLSHPRNFSRDRSNELLFSLPLSPSCLCIWMNICIQARAHMYICVCEGQRSISMSMFRRCPPCGFSQRLWSRSALWVDRLPSDPWGPASVCLPFVGIVSPRHRVWPF